MGRGIEAVRTRCAWAGLLYCPKKKNFKITHSNVSINNKWSSSGSIFSVRRIRDRLHQWDARGGEAKKTDVDSIFLISVCWQCLRRSDVPFRRGGGTCCRLNAKHPCPFFSWPEWNAPTDIYNAWSFTSRADSCTSCCLATATLGLNYLHEQINHKKCIISPINWNKILMLSGNLEGK
jgi:hypothetical protein